MSLLTACGSPLSAPRGVVTPVATEWAAEGVERGVDVAFNDAYLERAELNESLCRANPRNTDKALLRLINGARDHIDGAFYDIEDLGVVDALLRARKRGVTIRLVTDSDNMVEKAHPDQARQAISRLKGAGIPVIDDRRSGIMHHKFMVVDSRVVWTGSTNLTPTSLYRHNNNALTIRQARLASAFEREFERLFVRREFGKAARVESLPSDIISIGEGATVQAFFSPAGRGRAAVVKELQGARQRIRFMTFSLTDPETGATLIERSRAGVKVEGIFDRWLAAGQFSLFEKFKAAKLEVRKDGNEALMHHKIIVVDSGTVITGSYNYSQNAENNNNEAFLIFRGARNLARAYTGEYDRLRHAAITNRPPAYKAPDPEGQAAEGP
ncbi:MAG: phospholipase D-like domain-containing protein [Candidatus Sericytochromatia bacterium]|nr:phospholipase D-like domain-containing protein [Candidatus Sericytochromatia bacterium]